MIKTILYVAVGGAAGSVLRFLTSIYIVKFWNNHFPLATFISNIAGCFLIGFFIGILEKYNLTNGDLKWLLITGFCGGYTTFSTFGMENYYLTQNNNTFLALTYIGLSVILGLLAVSLGLLTAK